MWWTFRSWRQGTGPGQETMNRRLNHEPDTILELNESAPGMWWFPTNPEHRCIYRVPYRLRRVNPEAYTPQLLLIGPLHRHSLKFQALDSRGDITNTKLMGYLNMEKHKKIYLARFSERLGVEGEKTIVEFRRIIKEDEDIIRASYSESTDWIESPKFVDMILHDSVFILELLLRSEYYNFLEHQKSGTEKITWDPIFAQPCLQTTVNEDLILLENQLPYFILEKLFDLIVPILSLNKTLRRIVINYFGFDNYIDDSRFKHFTDLFRCVRVVTLKSKTNPTDPESLKFKRMYNAEKLYSAGVKFKAVGECSIDVRFENGCLEIPCLWVPEDTEIALRNIMALEQCHYPLTAYVCNFVSFLDFLIDTDKDVDLLMEKGILNFSGERSSVAVAEMVNTLFSGVVDIRTHFYYAGIASRVNAYYDNPVNRSRAILGRQYFGNLWRGTATVAATLLLVMTLIQTVASIIQGMQK